MSTESEKKGIEASFKSMDTEEFLIRRVLLFPQQTSILKTVILVG